MSRIIINGRFLVHRITGVERYAREITAELDNLAAPGEMELAVPPEVRAEEIPAYRNIRAVRVGRLHNRPWEHVSFPAYVRRQKAVSLNLCNTAPLPDPGVVCIHDMKTKARPQDFSRGFLAWYRLLFRNETRRARMLITVSEFSKREICRYYGVAPERILVAPNSWQHFARIGFDEGALEKYGLERGKYAFSMSSMEPNKNFRWIAAAARKDPAHTYAVAGAINREVFAGGPGFACPENMKLLGYVSDAEARTLMRDCRAFLFPTFYEGFGIPPLEALSAGCPRVVVSDTEVMHEVFGNGVSYVDPADLDGAGVGIFEDGILGNEATGLSDHTLADGAGAGLSDHTPAGAAAAGILARYSWAGSARKLYCALKKQGIL